MSVGNDQKALYPSQGFRPRPSDAEDSAAALVSRSAHSRAPLQAWCAQPRSLRATLGVALRTSASRHVAERWHQAIALQHAVETLQRPFNPPAPAARRRRRQQRPRPWPAAFRLLVSLPQIAQDCTLPLCSLALRIALQPPAGRGSGLRKRRSSSSAPAGTRTTSCSASGQERTACSHGRFPGLQL